MSVEYEYDTRLTFCPGFHFSAILFLVLLHRFGIESQKTRKTMGGKRSWSNPGKIGQGKLIGSCNSLPSATLARELE